LLALLSVFVVDTSAGDGVPLMFLEGEWVSSDYDCPAGVFHKKVAISISDNDMKAVNADSEGDNCVSTGSDSFRGSLPSELSMEQALPIVMILGWPSRPACCTGRAYIVMQDVDNFKICLQSDCSRRGRNWDIGFSRIKFVPQL
jgi:hypothetical protein